MAGFLKNKILGGMQSIAQMGSQNGGPNNFYDPGMAPPRLAQGPTDEQNAQALNNEIGGQLQRLPNATPYVPPQYGYGNYALPNDYQIGYNQNYSDPNDPNSTAFALQQGVHSLATGAVSAKQNKKFQRGEAAQSLVRDFLAPLAGALGPAGAAAGIKDYMKTSSEQAVKRKEMNLKEQADAITQMKTMADMLKDNNPYTKDQLEQIVKRAKAEQEIRSEQTLQAQREQAARTDAMQGYEKQAGATKNLAEAMNKRANVDLLGQKGNNEVLKGGKITAETKDKEEAAALKKDTREQIVPARKAALDAAATASTARAGLANSQAAEVAPLAKAKRDLMQVQEEFVRRKKDAAKEYTGEADEGAINKIASELPPGEISRFQAAIAISKKHNGGKLNMADLIAAKNMSMGAHEKMLLQEKGKRAAVSGRPVPPGGAGIKF